MTTAQTSDDLARFDHLFEKAIGSIHEFKPENFVPMYGTILVRMYPRDKQTKGGIVIPDAHQEDKNLGVVMAVSEEESDFKPGEIMYFRAYANEAMNFDGKEDYRLVQNRRKPDGDIFGKFVPEDHHTKALSGVDG